MRVDVHGFMLSLMTTTQIKTMTSDELIASIRTLEGRARAARKRHELSALELEWRAVCRELNERATAEILAPL